MSEQDNIRIAEESLDSINTRTLEETDDLYAEGYSTDGPGAGGLALEESRANTQVYIEAFPDLHFEVLRRIAQGDYVVLDWVGTGTNTGPMRTPTGNTIPATGTKGTIYGSTTYEIKAGKIVHSWTYWDRVAMLEQMGLMQPM